MNVQFEKFRDEYTLEERKLAMELKSTEKRGKNVQAQRQRESGTFVNDVQTLRKRVSAYEKHIKKLKILVDKEDTQNLIKELDN